MAEARTYESRERLTDMLERYGECCTTAKAGHILGRAPGTVRDMLADGRLRRVCGGRMVDVRSIAEYIERPDEINRETRVKKKRARNGTYCRFSV